MKINLNYELYNKKTQNYVKIQDVMVDSKLYLENPNNYQATKIIDLAVMLGRIFIKFGSYGREHRTIHETLLSLNKSNDNIYDTYSELFFQDVMKALLTKDIPSFKTYEVLVEVQHNSKINIPTKYSNLLEYKPLSLGTELDILFKKYTFKEVINLLIKLIDVLNLTHQGD